MKLGRFKFRLGLSWQDMWVGVYWDTSIPALLICLLPCVVLKIEDTRRREKRLRKIREQAKIGAYLGQFVAKAFVNDTEKLVQKLKDREENEEIE